MLHPLADGDMMTTGTSGPPPEKVPSRRGCTMTTLRNVASGGAIAALFAAGAYAAMIVARAAADACLYVGSALM